MEGGTDHDSEGSIVECLYLVDTGMHEPQGYFRVLCLVELSEGLWERRGKDELGKAD